MEANQYNNLGNLLQLFSYTSDNDGTVRDVNEMKKTSKEVKFEREKKFTNLLLIKCQVVWNGSQECIRKKIRTI